jgi:cobalt-zinc-cadmium resistance protein CzcA
MLSAIISFSIRRPGWILLGTVGLLAMGVWSLPKIEMDAFPDTTPVQVQVNTLAPALSAEEVERQVTQLLEQALAGLPRLERLRSVSQFGLSQVVATFAEGTDIYWARQVVNERLAAVTLPAGIERPRLGPIATGLGEVFHYLLRGGEDLAGLRTLQDWVLRPRLRAVPGVAEVNSWGGWEKQYQVRLTPYKLLRHELPLSQVLAALEANNGNVGGGLLRHQGQALPVQGIAQVRNAAQVAQIVLWSRQGVPLRVHEVAQVAVGTGVRRGAVTADGQGEVVLGLGFSLLGENSTRVAAGLRQEFESLRARLPADVQAEVVLDRTELVEQVLATVRSNLLEAGLLVVAVLFLFLGSWRAACLVALAIPLSFVCALVGMAHWGIAASLLSLGALDFGLVVDSSVVLVENCVRRLARSHDPRQRLDRVCQAALEVRRPTLFGELIILIVYLPILTLEGVEGKLFRPMALTVLFALGGSLVLSLTLMPALVRLVPLAVPHRPPLLLRLLTRGYLPILRWTLRHRGAVLVGTLGVVVLAFGGIAPRLGSEFLPSLSEGALTLGVVRLPGTRLEQSLAENTQLERALLQAFPDEIRHVWSRIGTAEVATDPMSLEMTDVFITLWPRSCWRRARTQEELTEQIRQQVRSFLGCRVAFSQPIKMRLDEMTAAVRADVALKIFGDDLDLLRDKAQELAGLLQTLPGAVDVGVEQVSGQPLVQVQVRQEELARYGVPARTILDIVEVISGKQVGEVWEGVYRFPLVVRWAEEFGASDRTATQVHFLAQLPVQTPSGEVLPLSRLADVSVLADRPSVITHENGQRVLTVTANVRGRDLGSFVAEAQARVAAEITLPSPRYYLVWGGQWEHFLHARQRLYLVVPLTLILVLSLLYVTYGNLRDALRVFVGVPLAAVGGLVALWLRGLPFSLPAAIGFIALSGIAVLDDMLLVSAIRRYRERGLPLDQAVERAALRRLRPILMTALVASLGMAPMAFSTGVGAEIQRPLATVVLGGVVSALVLSLLVVRVLYLTFRGPVPSVPVPGRSRRLPSGDPA